MANEMTDIIHDIAHRIGEYEMVEPFHHATILRAVNRIYRSLNTELHSLEKSYAVAAGTFSSTVKSIDKPSDMVRPFLFQDSDGDMLAITYVLPNDFNASSGVFTFTIIGDVMYFSNVDEDSEFTIWYYSAGSTLVDKEDADLSDGEANAPEWARHYWDVLYYGASVELKTDYPMYRNDTVEYSRLRGELKYSTQRKQHSITPMIPGGVGSVNVRNDYDYPGLT